MIIGIPQERHPGERRVAAVPDTVQRIITELGYQIQIEPGAGAAAGFDHRAYEAAGAAAVDAESIWSTSDIILTVRPPTLEQAGLLKSGAVLIGLIWPAQNEALLHALADRGVTVLAMDRIPRVTRAQKMDALSSMANLAGYRSVIEAAEVSGRFFMGQMTAAGKIPPAKVLVIGAGVAGLAAIGAARAMGAIVRAFDARPVVKEQVESLGAEFLEVAVQEDGSGEGGYAKEVSNSFLEAEHELFARQAAEVDVIITTALIPGKPAPCLLNQHVVDQMKPGSVIVDLAAEQGGNCELTKAGEVVVHNGVIILGYTDLPSRMPAQASQLYGTNLYHLLTDLGTADQFAIRLDDEIVDGACVVHAGALRWPPPERPAPEPAKSEPIKASEAAPSVDIKIAVTTSDTVPPAASSTLKKRILSGLGIGTAAVLLTLMGLYAPREFLLHFTVFVLACFVGWKLIWGVKPSLHTPLMSVTNAISGIIIIGGILQFNAGADPTSLVLGGVAVLVASINIFGGFLVTQRMLAMFRK